MSATASLHCTSQTSILSSLHGIGEQRAHTHPLAIDKHGG